MRKLLILAAIAALTGCSSMRSHAPTSAPVAVTDSAALVAVTDPPPIGESDDPLVRFLTSQAVKTDEETALKINALAGDKVMAQCVTWLASADTLRKASELHGGEGVLQIVPIAPTGPLSVLAEARRVKQDVESGSLSARLAAHRKSLAALVEDYDLACGPLKVEVLRFGLVTKLALP